MRGLTRCGWFVVRSHAETWPDGAYEQQLRHKAGKGGSQSARGASKAERATWACQSAKTAAELRAAIESASKVEVSTIDLEHELDQAIERLSKLVAEE